MVKICTLMNRISIHMVDNDVGSLCIHNALVVPDSLAIM